MNNWIDQMGEIVAFLDLHSQPEHKIAPRMNEKGFDGHKKINGRKRQIQTDIIELVWNT